MWTSRGNKVVAQLIAKLSADQLAGTHAARLKALPIGGSLWADYYLRSDGTVIVVGEVFDHPDVVSEYAEWNRVVSVLVWGAERYPELCELLPTRGRGDIDCRCRNIPIFASGKVNCPDCGGLGWLANNG